MPPGALARKISTRNSQLLFGRIVSSGDWDAATAVPPASAQDGQFWKATSAGTYGGATIPNGALCLFSENLTVVHYLVQEAGAGGGGDWGGDWDMSVTSGTPTFPLDMPELEVIDYFQTNEKITITSRADLSVGGHAATVTLAEGVAGVRAAVSTKTSNGSVGKKVLGFRFTFPALSSSPTEAVSVLVMFDSPTSQAVGPLGFQWDPTTGLWTAPELGGMVIPNGSIFGFVIDAVAGTFTAALDNTVITSGPSAYPDGLVAYVAITTENVHASSVGKVVGAEFVVDPSEFSGFTWAAGAGAVVPLPVALPAGAAEGKEYRAWPEGGVYDGKAITAGDVVKFIDGTTSIVRIPSVNGENGWAAVLAVETYGEARVLRITDWVGGTGSKPASGMYIGSSGTVTDIWDAADIRGGQGLPGADGQDGVGITGGWDASPPFVCAYPLAPNAYAKAQLGATYALTGTGDGNRFVHWECPLFSESAIATHADIVDVGAITMADQPVWFEWKVSANGSYRLRCGAFQVDEGGSIISNHQLAKSSDTAPYTYTFGFFPDGSWTAKRDGATLVTSAGGPTPGKKVAPYVFFFQTTAGVTASAEFVGNKGNMQYAGAGVGVCVATEETDGVLPEGAIAGNVYEVVVGGRYQGTRYAVGDLAIVRSDGTSLTRLSQGVDTRWEPAALVNDWVNVGGAQAAQYRKVGDNVEVRFAVMSGTAATLFTLPAGFRPPATIGLVAQVHGAGGPEIGHVRVEADGDVLFENHVAISSHELWAVFSFSTAA